LGGNFRERNARDLLVSDEVAGDVGFPISGPVGRGSGGGFGPVGKPDGKQQGFGRAPNNKARTVLLRQVAGMKETMMIRAAILALAAVATLFPWSAQRVEAREAPWCAVIANSTESVYWDCQYNSIEQCRAVVLAGSRGWCNPSPYATGTTEPKRKVRKGHSS